MTGHRGAPTVNTPVHDLHTQVATRSVLVALAAAIGEPLVEHGGRDRHRCRDPPVTDTVRGVLEWGQLVAVDSDTTHTGAVGVVSQLAALVIGRVGCRHDLYFLVGNGFPVPDPPVKRAMQLADRARGERLPACRARQWRRGQLGPRLLRRAT